ncbi:MAG: hypothetical protein QNJ00_17890 [Woeseiaceae bacterium]|nr:hypothetical protein [Woeseiaceae bacterium]
MNWEAISAIAEVVGVTAVVISLVYLAYQVRGNTDQLERSAQANRTQNWQSVCVNFNEWRQMLAMPGNSEIWIRGINDLRDLSQDERVVFNNMANCMFWAGWFMYHIQRSEGLMNDVNANAYRDLYRHPGLREWIEVSKKAQLTDVYSDFLDEVKDSVGRDRINPGEASSYSQGEY